ncbi:hypothetical protein HRR83_004337 [Exophiala dermatitidis]|uniref:Rhodopsin domain-containing protein n=2 Tax=Exophiala dermatitidis TaxID=5970 RepID=H6BQE7_EXODN|nr:uncharacterized protein HMPREF1120_02708 [Exophiala dermatitidis NIH/UT8656]KAJ4511625.1 hypothetical protein HRR73_006200 [Exophiala dermatitidis]EHY54540.1 hypothetical protein HMPREF1120_02708 [Exophiala dermatitidis NIH/UT8656]KAJ4517701.1 hypothetical protein HRR75_002919 [Exophiala dermatitidis]KAJ4521358.1 hypothetical protein HRR74_003181 [Exophiala dermatitidis]KAJ4542029.1 hypothetical protein HRR77_005917 [Exophiala dermatitidis]
MAKPSILAARTPTISADQKGPVVDLVSWIAMTTMCLAVITVLVSKLVVLRKLVWRDGILVAAMLFSIGFTIAINKQVSHGLGSRRPTLSTDDYLGFQKAGYAWNILYIASLALGKSSTLLLLLTLAPSKRYRRPMLGVAIVVGLWALSSILGSAFQCELPQPYLITMGKCFDQHGFWTAIGIIDIVTDVLIVALPIYLVHNLQLPRHKKVAVCFAFSFRLAAVGCTSWRLATLGSFFDRRSNKDIPFDSWPPTVATILEVFFDVFSACVPHLRPFMDSIQAGYLSGMVQDGSGRFGYGNDSYLMGKTAQTHSKSRSQGRTQALTSHGGNGNNIDFGVKESSSDPYSRAGADGDSLDLPRQRPAVGVAIGQTYVKASSHRAVANAGKTAAVKTAKDDHVGRVTARPRSESIISDGAGSHGSDGSNAMIIKTTKEWTVTYEDA